MEEFALPGNPEHRDERIEDVGLPSTPEDESHLVARVVARDERAFSELYDRYSRVVYSVALRVVHDTSAAEDILHDVFLQLWRDPSRFDSARGELASWMAVIARNRAIDWVRKQRPQVEPENVALMSRADVSAEVEHSSMIAKVRDLMRQMPENQRRALEMAFFDGLTHVDIAQRTGEPLGTIKTRIRSAVMAIRKAWGQ